MITKELLYFLRKPGNIVTSSRGICMITYGILIVAGVEINKILAAFLIIYGYILGDNLDGWVARKTNTTSAFGEIWDVVNDKVADVIFAMAVLLTAPEFAWVVFIFLVFKVAIETLIWRTVGNQNHLNPDNVRPYSKMYAWLAEGWPLEGWVFSKAFFFVPVLLGVPIPYYGYVFSAIIIIRSYVALEMLNWHARNIYRQEIKR